MSDRAAILAKGIGFLSREDTEHNLNLCRCMVCGRTIDPDNDMFAGELIQGDGLDSGPLFHGVYRENRIVVRCWPCERAAFALRSGVA